MLSLIMSIADIMDKKEKTVALYDRYYPLMCYIAKENLPPEHHKDIDDIVQETLIDLMLYIDRVDIDDDVRTRALCVTVTRRRAIDHIRRKDNRNLSLEDIYEESASEAEDPDVLLDKKATLDLIVEAIAGLEDSYKDVCRLKYVHQKTEKEIAEILGLTPKAVNMRIMRGKNILRDILRKELYGE